jgi:hypothetical protein
MDAILFQPFGILESAEHIYILEDRMLLAGE